MKPGSAISRFIAFIVDVRREIDKVTWPGRKEVVVTTVVVFVMAAISSLFFSLVDTGSYKLVHSIIG
jgi:preprotein translocase subunit SecE